MKSWNYQNENIHFSQNWFSTPKIHRKYLQQRLGKKLSLKNPPLFCSLSLDFASASFCSASRCKASKAVCLPLRDFICQINKNPSSHSRNIFINFKTGYDTVYWETKMSPYTLSLTEDGINNLPVLVVESISWVVLAAVSATLLHSSSFLQLSFLPAVNNKSIKIHLSSEHCRNTTQNDI